MLKLMTCRVSRPHSRPYDQVISFALGFFAMAVAVAALLAAVHGG